MEPPAPTPTPTRALLPLGSGAVAVCGASGRLGRTRAKPAQAGGELRGRLSLPARGAQPGGVGLGGTSAPSSSSSAAGEACAKWRRGRGAAFLAGARGAGRLQKLLPGRARRAGRRRAASGRLTPTGAPGLARSARPPASPPLRRPLPRPPPPPPGAALRPPHGPGKQPRSPRLGPARPAAALSCCPKWSRKRWGWRGRMGNGRSGRKTCKVSRAAGRAPRTRPADTAPRLACPGLACPGRLGRGTSRTCGPGRQKPAGLPSSPRPRAGGWGLAGFLGSEWEASGRARLPGRSGAGGGGGSGAPSERPPGQHFWPVGKTRAAGAQPRGTRGIGGGGKAELRLNGGSALLLLAPHAGQCPAPRPPKAAF